MIRLHALNGIAWVALRFRTPREAKCLVAVAAKLLARPLREEVSARKAADQLDPFGSCLSRAMAIAAVFPTAEVVIGVRPGASETSLFAHAWVEWGGRPLRATDVVGSEIVRF